MFHLFHWKTKEHHECIFLENDHFWIEVTYTWTKKKGTYFLHPAIDQTQNTIRYYAFDSIAQKKQFGLLTKIQWIWGKSGYHLSMLPTEELREAIDAVDMKYFQKLPGIWPKTAKRIIVELKQKMTSADLGKIDIDEALYTDIIASLKTLGYEARRVKKILPDCPVTLTKEKLPDIMKRLISHM